MSSETAVKQLLESLEAAGSETEQRRIRRQLRKLGHYVSKHGRTAGGVAVGRREGPPSVVTTLRLEGDLHRRLQLLAADEGKSANAILEDLLRKHLDEQGVPSRLRRER